MTESEEERKEIFIDGIEKPMRVLKLEEYGEEFNVVEILLPTSNRLHYIVCDESKLMESLIHAPNQVLITIKTIELQHKDPETGIIMNYVYRCLILRSPNWFLLQQTVNYNPKQEGT